jgi:hypothetical protein
MALFCVFFALCLTGCGDKAAPAARILSVAGTVQARVSSGIDFAAAKPGMELKVGGAIRTGSNSNARILTHFDSMKIDVSADSFFEVREGKTVGFQGEGKAVYDVNKQKSDAVIETPHGATAVLGTKFGQQIGSDSVLIIVEKGKVRFTGKSGQNREIIAGQKFAWIVSEPMPTVVEANLIDSEGFFGNVDAFEMQRR